MEENITKSVEGKNEPVFFKDPGDIGLQTAHHDIQESIRTATETITVELDPDLKEKAEKVLAAIGWTLEEALILFLHWCVSDPERAGRWAKEQIEKGATEEAQNSPDCPPLLS